MLRVRPLRDGFPQSYALDATLRYAIPLTPERFTLYNAMFDGRTYKGPPKRKIRCAAQAPNPGPSLSQTCEAPLRRLLVKCRLSGGRGIHPACSVFEPACKPSARVISRLGRKKGLIAMRRIHWVLVLIVVVIVLVIIRLHGAGG